MSRSIRSRVIAVTATALGLGALVVLSSATQAAAVGSVPVLGHVPSTPLYDVGVHGTLTNAGMRNATAAFSPLHFTTTVKDGANTYTDVMVGKNPSKRTRNGLATIKTLLVPLIINFSNGDTWDPTTTDSCDAGGSALARTQNSPIFVSQPWTWGGTPIGTGQVTDAFQRAEFWTYAQPTGVDPTYGVQLALTTVRTVTINVPTADAAAATGVPCGNGLLGLVEINWLDSYLRTTVIPSLASQGLTARTLPIFLLHNVAEYIGTTSQCCVLGYHSAYAPSAGVIQTYGLSMYDNSSLFTGSGDVSALSHEVGEWQNDPYGTNSTLPWGHVGQVTACQGNLEVGDPLSGTTFADPVGGFTYHPQELAFYSWFYHQSPSLGVNGWYSDRGTFTTSAAHCP